MAARGVCRPSSKEQSLSLDKINDLLLKDFPIGLSAATRIPLFREFLQTFVPHNNAMEATIRRLLVEMAGVTLNQVDRSEAFKIYIHDPMRDDPYGSGPEYLPPSTITGLRSLFSKQVDEFQKNAVTYIREWFRRRHYIQ